MNPSPARIMEVGMAFWPSKVLLSAVELGVFTALGGNSMTGRELMTALELHPRANPDFFDTLVALRFLDRDGDGPEGRYCNTEETGLFLDRNSPQFIGGFLEMANARLYGFWGDLTEALRTGSPQNEIKHTGASMFGELYSKPERLEQFMDAMSGISAGNFQAFADKFDFSRYHTMCDVGGATGQLSMFVASKHPHLRCTSALTHHRDHHLSDLGETRAHERHDFAELGEDRGHRRDDVGLRAKAVVCLRGRLIDFLLGL